MFIGNFLEMGGKYNNKFKDFTMFNYFSVQDHIFKEKKKE